MAPHSSTLAWKIPWMEEPGVHGVAKSWTQLSGFTSLGSILKRRDITLSTKVHLVKAMVFPVVMYGYDCWTVKKAEH